MAALGGVVAGTAPPLQPLPANLDQLDPAVRRLVEERAESVRVAPESASAWLELAIGFEANVLWPDARDAYERSAALGADDPWTRLHLAVAIREAGDFMGSLERLRALAAELPDLGAVQQRVGLVLLESGELAEALAAFERLIRVAPEAPHGYVGAGEALVGLGRYDEAVDRLRRAIELAPGHRGAYHRLGLALRGLGETEESARALARGTGAGISYLPDPLTPRVIEAAVNVTARVDRAAGLLGAGRAGEAEALLRLCLADHPRNLTVLNNLAIALMRQQRLDEARTLLDRALVVNEGKFSTYINLSSLAMRSGSGEEALEFARAAVERGPRSARTHATLARALAGEARFAEAVDSIEIAVGLEAENPQHRLMAASLTERTGDLERAYAHYLSADELVPDQLPIRIGLARTAIGLGRGEAAASAIDAAAELAPGHPAIDELRRRLAEMESSS